MSASNPNIRNQLRGIIDATFNREDLITLCIRLGIPFQDLEGKGKRELVTELILYCERHDLMEDLIEYVQRERPSASERLNSTLSGPEQKFQSPIQQRPIENISKIADDEYLSSARTQEGVVDFSQDGPVESAIDTADDGAQTDEPEPINPFQTIEPDNSVLLTTRHGVQIFGAVSQTPWNLPVDAFVLPLGFGTNFNPGAYGSVLEVDLERAQAAPLADVFHKSLEMHGQTVLTPDTPFLLLETPSSHWTLPGSERKVIAATANDGEDFTPENAAVAAKAIIQLAGANNLGKVTIPPLGGGAAGLSETAVALQMLDAILEAIPQTPPGDPAPDLKKIILTAMNAETITALRQKFMRRPQPALNDQPVGEDLLQVETAVSALAEMCMLKDSNPPLAIGILGGWGSGKSFVMHLMQERVAQLRSLQVTDEFYYIGHVYQITFNAWTYTKSNLWASLMQTIFFELNSQLARERAVALALAQVDSEEGDENKRKLNDALRNDSPLWQLISYPELRERHSRELISFAWPLHQKLQHTPPKKLAKQAEAWLRSEEASQAAPTEATAVAEEDRLWVELRNLKAEEREKLRKKEEDLAKMRQDLEAAQIELQKEVNRDLGKESRDLAWQPLKNLFAKQFGIAYDQIEQRFTQEESDSNLFSGVWHGTKALVQMVLNNPVEFLAFLLFAVFLFYFQQNSVFLSEVELPDWLLATGTLAAGLARSYTKWTTLIQESFSAYQNQVEEERHRLERTRPEMYEQKLAKQREIYLKKLEGEEEPGQVTIKDNVPSLQDKVTKLETETEQLRQRVGMTAGYVSLLDFVSSRLDDAIYEKELGLMHQVQRDLAELSDSLTAVETLQSLFPRGKPRIMLYIDDLDRCPPERVVEVLEAVQLLLKTDLFIVVLAVDVRFITRALEAKYKGILTRRGSPSGLDYIEKIVQIPYRIQPIEPEAVGGYLDKQMLVIKEGQTGTGEAAGGTAVATGGQDEAQTPSVVDESSATVDVDRGRDPEKIDTTEGDQTDLRVPHLVGPVEISQSEFDCMQFCCQKVNMTPRAIKRLANVFKLLKIIWHYEGSRPNEQMVKVVMNMLTLSEGYPNQMRELFEAIVPEIINKSTDSFSDFVKAQTPDVQKDTFEGQTWQRLTNDVKNLKFDIALQNIDLKTLIQVRSFCFVGDIGYDPNEMMKAFATTHLETSDKQSQPSSSNSHEKSENS